MSKLAEHGAIPALCRLTTFPGKTGHDSLAALLVMTFSPTESSTALVMRNAESSLPSPATEISAVEEKMIDANAIGRATEVALSFTDLGNDEERKHVFRAMALLANLTRSERGAAGFLLGGAKQLRKLENEIENEIKNADEQKEVSPSVQLLLGRFLSDKYIREDDKKDKVASGEDPLGIEDENDDDSNDGTEDEDKVSTQDPYLHFASVLTNITQINAGRNFITSMHIHNHAIAHLENDDKKKPLAILPPTLRTFLTLLRTSTSTRRRRGIAATIKNCCFDTNISKLWILPLHKRNNNTGEKGQFTIHTNDDMLTSLLYPLTGPEEITDENDLLLMDPILYSQGPDKVREVDSKTRLHIIETILLLCASGRQVREILRSKGAYVVLKYADLVEEEEGIGEKINECVQFLKRDEEGLMEGESDNIALEMARERRRIQEDYDGVD